MRFTARVVDEVGPPPEDKGLVMILWVVQLVAAAFVVALGFASVALPLSRISVQVDPATLSNEDREARGIRLLPTNQMEAMLALRADPVMMNALGHELAAVYLAVHTSEYAAFRRETAGFEIQHHLLKF